MARGAATSLSKFSPKSRFFNVVSSGLFGRYLGDTEKSIAALFKIARKYIVNQEGKLVLETDPNVLKSVSNIIFIDEIDGIALSRMLPGTSGDQIRIANQLIMEMDGLESSGAEIYFIGATNAPWRIDEAIQRRIGLKIYIQLPSPKDRLEIIRLYLGVAETDKLRTETNSKKVEQLELFREIKEKYRVELEKIFTKTGINKTRLSFALEWDNGFPLLLSSTAFFSNSDLEQLAISILSTAIDYGISHYWEQDPTDLMWKVTEESTENPASNVGYRSILELDPNVLDIHEPIELSKTTQNPIRDLLKSIKPSNRISELYRYEWFYVTGVEQQLPRPEKLEKGTKETDLWILYNYHMSLFKSGNDYAQEITMRLWRAIMQSSLNVEDKRTQVLKFFRPKNDPDTFITDVNSIARVLNFGLSFTPLSKIGRFTGLLSDLIDDSLKAPFQLIFDEYMIGWYLHNFSIQKNKEF